MFAKKTKVPAEKSAFEIKRATAAFGCKNFRLGTSGQKAYVGFTYKDLKIKIEFSLPPQPGNKAGHADKKRYEQAVNTRWRQILLCIKAKLESINTGIETFEEAFMAHIQNAKQSRAA